MTLIVAATVPMFAAELAPANIRGALVMGWQLWTAFGKMAVREVTHSAEIRYLPWVLRECRR